MVIEQGGALERREKFSRLTVEVGSGGAPFYENFGIVQQPNEYYIQIESQPDSPAHLSLLEGYHKSHSSQSEVLYGNAKNTGLPESSVDTVVFSDVLNAHPTGIDPARAVFAVRDEDFGNQLRAAYFGDKLALVEEALRILKPGGRIKIYMDAKGRFYFHKPGYDQLLDELRSRAGIRMSNNTEEEERISKQLSRSYEVLEIEKLKGKSE